MSVDGGRAFPVPTLRWGAARRWAWGAAAGVVGGAATLLINPLFALVEVTVWAYLDRGSRRIAGLSGGLLGHGLAWAFLLLNARLVCLASEPPICAWSMYVGGLGLSPAAPWQTATDDSSFGTYVALVGLALGLLLIGLVLSVRTWLRSRRGGAAPG
jgi:hypothetical protein